MPTIQERPRSGKPSRWRAMVRVKGHELRTRTFDRKTDATRWAAKLEAEVRDGERVSTRQEERSTVQDLVDRYRRDHLSALASAANRENHLVWWVARIGHRTLIEVRRPLLRDCLRALAAGETPSGRPASPATRRRYLATLRHAWNVVAIAEEWTSRNPFRGALTGADSEPRGRVRYLEDAERERLIDAAQAARDPRLFPLVLLALLTGARQGELLALRWRDLDLAGGRAILEDTKNGERRALTLAPAAVAALRALPRRLGNELVFPDRRGRATFPRESWERAVAAAALEDFRFHDLRHTFASYALSAGASLGELAHLMGHKTLAMVKRYAHLERHRAAAVAMAVGERVAGAAV